MASVFHWRAGFGPAKTGSAKGVCFITLEDETGVANLVIWPKMFKAYRPVIMAARLLVVKGRVQTDGRVIHVVADDLYDRSDRLSGLSDVHLSQSRPVGIIRRTDTGSGRYQGPPAQCAGHSKIA